MSPDASVPIRKVLRLDILELELCCHSVAETMRNGLSEDYPEQPYLNLETGEIEYHADEVYDEDTEGGAEEIDWSRFRSFPSDADHLDGRDLREFVESIGEERHREELLRVVGGCGTFRRVKDYMYGSGDKELIHAWQWFERRKLRERIVAWLHTAGIEPDWGTDIFAPAFPLDSKARD